MKNICFLLVISMVMIACTKNDIVNKNVEASCGQCQFQMQGKGCDLAVKINGKGYYVEGTNIDDHGDAHASNGFCEAIRTATVSGNIINNKFVATSFKLKD